VHGATPNVEYSILATRVRCSPFSLAGYARRVRNRSRNFTIDQISVTAPTRIGRIDEFAPGVCVSAAREDMRYRVLLKEYDNATVGAIGTPGATLITARYDN